MFVQKLKRRIAFGASLAGAAKAPVQFEKGLV